MSLPSRSHEWVWRTALIFACAHVLSASSSFAQQNRPAAPTPTPPAEVAAPYEPQLLRLAEIMGALAYLRDLCGDKDGDRWRARMAGLMDAESASEGRKERLAGAYNRGFRGFEVTYRACTPNARVVIERYLDEGGRIARDVGSRFGGG
jgi:uncharacterized protein (TIGR02301 family)